ncbi:choline-binding transcriptional repressor BetI [Prosthecodimorpha hirschii]|uniref:choline-binding transcriptional repressor BetI n=1 Tax=Prosthecodimorpha hirschii TaxID=665126 RepID=UPI0015E38CF2|nr:transcriptional regulator BetI [Prosthecomicrobium hirschii]
MPQTARRTVRARTPEAEDWRRRQIIEATIDEIAAVGFAQTTLAGIAGRAGISTGLVAFYFTDKGGLLEATLRHLAAGLGALVSEGLRAAGTPRERIQAVIDANLGECQFERRIATVWLAFWGEVTVMPRFRRVQRVYERRMISNLKAGFRGFAGPDAAQRLAEATAAMIDGVWLRATLSVRPLDSAAARATVSAFVDAQLALLALALVAPAPTRTRP